MRRSALFLFTTLLILAQGACFGEPRIAFVETTHDFGEIETGKSVKHVFKFTNAGNAILQIKRIESG